MLDSLAEVVLGAIVAAPEAWSVWAEIDRRWPGALDRLELAGLVERWERPDYLAVTLTPLAAEVVGVQIVEHWHYESRDLGMEQHPPSHHVQRVADEVPGWSPLSVEPGPIHLPPRALEVPLRCPERLPDPHTVQPTRYVTDEMTGEPITLFGRLVPVDPRLKGGRG